MKLKLFKILYVYIYIHVCMFQKYVYIYIYLQCVLHSYHDILIWSLYCPSYLPPYLFSILSLKRLLKIYKSGYITLMIKILQYLLYPWGSSLKSLLHLERPIMLKLYVFSYFLLLPPTTLGILTLLG